MHGRSIIGKKPAPPPYHGWLVVAAAFLVAIYGFGLGFYGPGIYLVALKALHGWPTSELSSAITTYYVLGATLLFFWVASLFDRHGARKVVVVGTVAMACGVVLLALVTRPFAQRIAGKLPFHNRIAAGEHDGRADHVGDPERDLVAPRRRSHIGDGHRAGPTGRMSIRTPLDEQSDTQ
jgi:hypothetical protein